MADPFLGEIKQVPYDFAPRGWMFCHGQLLSIGEYSALYAVMGDRYGGDGITTFGLPDLRGRVPMGAGYGPGLTPRQMGEMGGLEYVSLATPQIPAHTHSASVSNAKGTLGVYNTVGNQTTVDGSTKSLAITGTSSRSGDVPDANTFSAETPDASIPNITVTADVAISNTGEGQPHLNLQPYTVVNYIIATDGLFPSRN